MQYKITIKQVTGYTYQKYLEGTITYKDKDYTFQGDGVWQVLIRAYRFLEEKGEEDISFLIDGITPFFAKVWIPYLQPVWDFISYPIVRLIRRRRERKERQEFERWNERLKDFYKWEDEKQAKK